MKKSVQIIGMGKYLPKIQVTAEELEAKMNLEPGWIMEKSGVRVRHFVADDESNCTMGAEALRRALENSGLEYEELDLIINASGSYDRPIPESSCLIQKAMGKGQSGIPSFTVDATCLSFMVAMDVASSMMLDSRYQKVAIVTGEVASRSLNYKEKESATLLADGSAAAILQPTPEGEDSQILHSHMETYGDGADLTTVRGGGNEIHPRNPKSELDDFTFHMNGPAVMTMAFKRLRGFMKELFEPLEFSLQELDLMVPHQASKVALGKGQQFMRLRDEQFMVNIEDHGNCIAASLPMALHDAIEQNRIKRGDKVCLMGTGAGLSLGGLVLIY